MEWTLFGIAVCLLGLLALLLWSRRSYRQFTRLPPEQRRPAAPRLDLPQAGAEVIGPPRANAVEERAAAWEQQRTSDPQAHDQWGVTTVFDKTVQRLPHRRALPSAEPPPPLPPAKQRRRRKSLDA